mmetsp:Transcript_78842/g.198104  ORF Transcript_78842/g.198104 Transcript_78842/m.198104 type:complete len:125 (+) Transcript_78842:303-677(+)
MKVVAARNGMIITIINTMSRETVRNSGNFMNTINAMGATIKGTVTEAIYRTLINDILRSTIIVGEGTTSSRRIRLHVVFTSQKITICRGRRGLSGHLAISRGSKNRTEFTQKIFQEQRLVINMP